MQLHRGSATLRLHDDPILPMVDNDGRVPAITARVKAMPPGPAAKVPLAIVSCKRGQVRGAQLHGLADIQVNPKQGTICGQHQQVAIGRINGADVQDTGETIQSKRERWMSSYRLCAI
jgi:hypothetical protein